MRPSAPLLAAFVVALAACAGNAPPAPAPAPARAAPLAVAGEAQAPVPSDPCALASGLPPLPAPALERFSPSAEDQKPEESARNLRFWIDTLADPALRGRSAGSAENKRVAALLAGAFASFGLRPPRPGGDHCLPFELGGVRDQNVVAHLARGGGPSAPAVIVGAHYDSQGVDAEGQVYPGADDNASGVAALLEIARLVSEGEGVQGKDVVFVAFGAEERGVLGAKAFVNNPTVPLGQVRLMVNLDMVGRPLLAGDAVGYVAGGREKARTLELLQRAAMRDDRPTVGIPEAVMTRLGFSSDSVPFTPYTPTLFLSTSIHADYHRPTDTPEKIDLDQIALTIRMVVSILEGV